MYLTLGTISPAWKKKRLGRFSESKGDERIDLSYLNSRVSSFYLSSETPMYRRAPSSSNRTNWRRHGWAASPDGCALSVPWKNLWTSSALSPLKQPSRQPNIGQLSRAWHESYQGAAMTPPPLSCSSFSFNSIKQWPNARLSRCC